MQPGLTVIDAGNLTGPLEHAMRAIDSRAGDDNDSLHIALARLAAGRFERVRSLIRDGSMYGEHGSATLPLITARYVAWTGDLHTAAAVWPRVRAAAAGIFKCVSVSGSGSVGDSDNATAPRDLTPPGQTPLDQTLLDQTPRDQTPPDLSRADVKRGSAGEHWLRAATASELQRTATDLGDVLFAASLHRRARAGGTDAGYAPAGGDGGFADSGSGHDRAGASLILDFVHGQLGAEPDATRHRIRLRPRLSTESRLDVRQIRFGDGALSIRVEAVAAAGRSCFTVRVGQDSGAIPVTLVLEPLVYGTVLRTAVDGHVADLAPRQLDDAILVPVQLVLDEERCLEIDVAI